jgi:two-component system LytT family sensor kinase
MVMLHENTVWQQPGPHVSYCSERGCSCSERVHLLQPGRRSLRRAPLRLPPAHRIAGVRAGYVLRLFLLCSVLFILEASSYMENEAGQVPPQWRELVGVAVVRWYSWMAVLPFIDRVARDTTPRSAWSLALHAGIAATFIAAHIGVVVAAENVAALGEQSRPFMLLPRLVPDAILYTLFAVSLTILESRRRRAGADARMRAALAEARLEALRQQLNPHFLFNTLNHIVMQVRLNETADALRMLLALSDLLHIVLADRAQLTTVRREMESVELYLEIERARFGAKLQVEATIDAQVLDALVPSFLLQPLLENAMRHGVSPATAPVACAWRSALIAGG